MTHSAAAAVAQPSFIDRPARPGRVAVNSSSAWPERRRRNAIGPPRRDTLDPLTILYAVEQTQAIVGLVDGRIVHWSRGAERLYGWTAKEAIGSRVGDLLKQKGAGASEDANAAELRHGEIWTGEFSRSHKDGRELAIAAQRVAGRDLSGRVTVIELNRLIEPTGCTTFPPVDPATSRVRQTQANGSQTHRVSHDLNNLLGIITLNLELARERAASEGELRKMIDEALDAAWRGCELTDRLAQPSRHRTG